MEKYTYEEMTLQQKLETYEWDSTWIELANRDHDHRILYIGDSISCGIRVPATNLTGKKILFDGFGTSKALDNPYFYDSLKLFAAQQQSRRAVLFNNGLHGWHMDDETEYRHYYKEMIKFLLAEFPGTPLYIVLTTHITDPEREARVIRRNQVAKELAAEYDLYVIDLYQVSLDAAHLLDAGGVHWLPEGYEMLAKEIIRCVSQESAIS